MSIRALLLLASANASGAFYQYAYSLYQNANCEGTPVSQVSGTTTDSRAETTGVCDTSLDTFVTCAGANMVNIRGHESGDTKSDCSGPIVITIALTLDACLPYTVNSLDGSGSSSGYVKLILLEGCPGSKSGSSDDDDPCFGRGTTTACRVAQGVTAAEALPQCRGDEPATTAESVLMSSLSAGDLVLADETSVTRVVVNQHVPSTAISSFVKLHHAGGALTLTPDHVVLLDGAWAAAREAKVGSLLSNGAPITAVTTNADGIINPLTVSGKILADGVVASTYPEWIHFYMHASQVYPLPISASSLLSLLFPQSTQAFYDTFLEPVNGNRAGLERYTKAVPAVFLTPAVAAVDIFIASSFLAAPALVAAAAGLLARKMKA